MNKYFIIKTKNCMSTREFIWNKKIGTAKRLHRVNGIKNLSILKYLYVLK
jgi:hypothetical protein